MVRKVLKSLVFAVGLILFAVAGLLGYAQWKTSRPVEAPYPPIVAARSPEALARGAAIFHASCEACHRAPDSARAAGARMDEVPAFLGTFYAANLTSDAASGIGALSDEQIARIIRYGVNRHGRVTVMPSYAMGDADVAALIGFLRSSDPLFQPEPKQMPPSRASLVGSAILLLTGAASPPVRPSSGIPVPTKAATVEYGRYMAHAVYDCAGCHTAGFSPQKTEGAEAFAGGFEFQDAAGDPVFSPNLTFHETGLASWTPQHLARALRDGFRPDGSILRSPMPRFRAADDAEVEALYLYLRSLEPRPAASAVAVARTATPPASPSHAADAPEALFGRLGCTACHAPGARYHANLAAAATKSPEELARWIRNPERFRPGTPMPTYEALLDESAALSLARWLRERGPSPAQ